MTAWPSVSVVIAHYGDPGPTAALCAALNQQEYAGALEVVVVDDCSPAPLRPLPGVEVVRRDRNGGFGSAVNTGAAHASGELLLVLNSDVGLPDRFLVDLVRAAAPYQPAVVGPIVRTARGREVTARRFPTSTALALERLGVLARFRHRPALQRLVGLDPAAMVHTDGGRACPVDWLVGVALLLPRSTFVDVGGFDERFHMYAEEVDLQRRLRDAGIGSYLVGSVTVDHVGGASSDPARIEQWLMDSRMAYAVKWGSGDRLRGALRLAAGVNLATSSVRRALGRPTRPWSQFRHDLSVIDHAHRAASPSS